MKTVEVNGIEIQVVEHMKEIKDVCDNAQLFKKWYNRNQMFKALLGQFIFDGEEDEIEYDFDEDEDDFVGTPCEYGDYGKLAGRIVDTRRSDCWFIELYKVEDISVDKFNELIDWEFNGGWGHPSFFIEDKSGNLYLIRTNID